MCVFPDRNPEQNNTTVLRRGEEFVGRAPKLSIGAADNPYFNDLSNPNAPIDANTRRVSGILRNHYGLFRLRFPMEL